MYIALNVWIIATADVSVGRFVDPQLYNSVAEEPLRLSVDIYTLYVDASRITLKLYE